MYKLCYYKGSNNFGDLLGPALLDYFGIKYVSVGRSNCDLITVGSIAQWATNNTTVVGSGIMTRQDRIAPGSVWKSCRGPITRKHVLNSGVQCPAIFGDPGVMLPMLQERQPAKHKVGIIPHYKHYAECLKKYGNNKDYYIIKISNKDPLAVAREISSCEKIISSSLHGVIAAHSYGIPAALVTFQSRLYGDGVKFDDYYQSVGLGMAEFSTVEKPKYTSYQKFDYNPLIEVYEELRDKQNV